MKLFRSILLLAVTWCCSISAASAFTINTLPRPKLMATTTTTTTTNAPIFRLSLSAESASGESSDNKPQESIAPQPESIPQERQTPVPQQQQQQQRRRLDPLIASLTKMDEETINAPYLQVPIWGELLLDKSLFVFLPVALFAIGGVALSLVVLFNSGDAMVDALAETAAWQSNPPLSSSSSSPSPVNDAVDACRGICSSQEQDLQSLRVFMKNLAGK